MKSGVFDFDAIGKRARELGIRPIHQTEDAEKAARDAEAAKRPSTGFCAYCQEHQVLCTGACWEC